MKGRKLLTQMLRNQKTGKFAISLPDEFVSLLHSGNNDFGMQMVSGWLICEIWNAAMVKV